MTSIRRCLALLGLPLLLATLGACPETSLPDDLMVEARVVLVPVAGGLDVRLADLQRPLRAVQVDVDLGEIQAVDATPRGAPGPNLVEAGLDSPRSRFTLVISDTRRVSLTNGIVAHIRTFPANAVPAVRSLANARAVDVDGVAAALETEVRP